MKKALDIALKKCNGEIIPIQVNEFDFSYLYNFATEAIDITGYHAVDQQQVLIYTKRGNTNNKK